MKKLLFLFSIAIIFFAASCNKEPTITIGDGDDCNIDPVVLTDDMLFGCNVNGKPWEFQGLSLVDAILNPNIFIDYQSNGVFSISGKRLLEPPCSSVDQKIRIAGHFPHLGDNKLSKASKFTDYNRESFRIDTLSPNTLHLTVFDTINKTASGTFYFQALNETYSDTIKVTDGRFNVTW